MHTLRRRIFTLSLVLLSLTVLLGYTRLVQVSQGGTGASTAAGARDAIEHASAGTIACASPCTPGAGIKVVTISGATTVNLPALSTYADGQQLSIVCDSASSCATTLDPSDSGTCDGGSAGAACSAITVPPHGIIGAVRTSSSAWGSVQPGSLTAIRSVLVTGSGSSIVAYEQALSGSTWVTISTLTYTEETTTCPLSVAGGVITLPSGAAATSATQSQCYEGYVLLSDASATFDALLVTGASWHLEMDSSAIEAITNARLGCLLARTAGTALDTAAENFVATRVGYASGVNNSWGLAGTGATYGTIASVSGTPPLTVLGSLTVASSPVLLNSGADYANSVSTLTTLPDRLYLTGGATSSATVADADYTGFECRFTLHAPEL